MTIIMLVTRDGQRAPPKKQLGASSSRQGLGYLAFTLQGMGVSATGDSSILSPISFLVHHLSAYCTQYVTTIIRYSGFPHLQLQLRATSRMSMVRGPLDMHSS